MPFNPTTKVLSKFYSNQAAPNLDEDSLRSFKRVAALRQELEQHSKYCVSRLKERTPRFKLFRLPRIRGPFNTQKALKLVNGYESVLEEMYRTEYRKRTEKMEFGVPGGLNLFHRIYRTLGPYWLFSKLLPIYCHLGALLGADTSQDQPLLNSEECRMIKDVLKEHWRWEIRHPRRLFMLFLINSSISFSWISFSLDRRKQQKGRDDLETHTVSVDVE